MEFIRRSEINKMKNEYADTVNGMVLSTYDILESENYFEGKTIIEDEEEKPMDAREAKWKLAEIRFKFQTNQISREQAHLDAQEPLRIFNEEAKRIAKKYGVTPKTLPDKIIYW